MKTNKEMIRMLEAHLILNDHSVDALRYLCYTPFPQGRFNVPDENKTIDQIRPEETNENE